MAGPKEYLVISSSLRTSSRSRILAEYLREYYESRQVSCAYLDLRAVSLPLCDGESAYSHPDVSKCAKLISEARVIIAATPVYNYDGYVATAGMRSSCSARPRRRTLSRWQNERVFWSKP